MLNRIHKFLVISTMLACALFFGCEKSISISSEDPPVPVSGKLFINSAPPGAQIYINGRNSTFVTPDTLPYLSEGEYQLTLKLKYYNDTTINISVRNNHVTEKFLDFTINPSMWGRIFCDSTPMDAEIFLNDSATNLKTPISLKNLLPGNYTVRYALKGYWDDSIKVTVTSGRSTSSYKKLTDSIEWVVFTSSNSSLPINSVSKVAIDNKGIKWIGTNGEGLVRFDGRDWKAYNTDNSLIPGNYIFSIACDEKGNVWAGTEAGLGIIDANENWMVYNWKNSSLPAGYINDIGFDGNTVWICSSHRGLVKYEDNVFTVYNSENSKIPSDSIYAIHVDNDGTKWAATGNGLIKFLNFGRSFEVIKRDVNSIYPPFPNNKILSVERDKKGTLWVGFDRGSVCYLKNDEWFCVENMPPNSVVSIAFDRNNNNWFSTNGAGIYQLKQDGWHTYDIKNTPIKTNWTNAVAVDENNHKWFATMGGGLVKYKGN